MSEILIHHTVLMHFMSPCVISYLSNYFSSEVDPFSASLSPAFLHLRMAEGQLQYLFVLQCNERDKLKTHHKWSAEDIKKKCEESSNSRGESNIDCF